MKINATLIDAQFASELFNSQMHKIYIKKRWALLRNYVSAVTKRRRPSIGNDNR